MLGVADKAESLGEAVQVAHDADVDNGTKARESVSQELLVDKRVKVLDVDVGVELGGLG